MKEYAEKLNKAVEKAIEKRPELKLERARIRRILRIAKSIKEIREAKGITQSQLAILVNKSQPFIARLESANSSKEPSMSTLDMIAHALNMELKFGFYEKENHKVA